MDDIYDKKSKIEDNFQKYLETKYPDIDDRRISLNYYFVQYKDSLRKSYCDSLIMFKDIFDNQGEEGKIYLWNTLYNDMHCNQYMAAFHKLIYKKYLINKQDFTAEQYRFLQQVKRVASRKEMSSESNFNKKILGDKVYVRPFTLTDSAKFTKIFLDNPHEYKVYTTQDIDPSLLRGTVSPFPTKFAIVDNKTKSFVGCVELFDFDNGRCDLGYYILPQHRGKGYAFEGARVLIDSVKQGKLVQGCETMYDGVFQKVKIEVNSIVTGIKNDNIPSLSLANKLGFEPVSKEDNDKLCGTYFASSEIRWHEMIIK